jgi:hypothetical protein
MDATTNSNGDTIDTTPVAKTSNASPSYLEEKISSMTERGEELPSSLDLPLTSSASGAGVDDVGSEGVEVTATNSMNNDNFPSQRLMSGLSASEGESVNLEDFYEEPTTPKSSTPRSKTVLDTSQQHRGVVPNGSTAPSADDFMATPVASGSHLLINTPPDGNRDIGAPNTEENDTPTSSNNNNNISSQIASPKAVDWIPQQNSNIANDSSMSMSGVTSAAVKMSDDVTETSYTTMTTVGDFGGSVTEGGRAGNNSSVNSPSLLMVDESTDPVPYAQSTTPAAAAAASSLSGGILRGALQTTTPRHNKLRGARSPRPPRHMRAVDWCPPSSSSLGVASTRGSAAAVGVAGSSFGGTGNMSTTSGANVASDKTAVTSRAVRLGDDATVTTFATMTTMGDAGSILEADMEEEEDDSSAGSGRSTSSGEDDSVDGEEYDEFMEPIGEEDNLVDKLPSFTGAGTSVVSGVTTQAVRMAGDCDRSITSYATMTTFGDLGSIYEGARWHQEEEEEEEAVPTANGENEDAVVDKVPSLTSTPGTSVISGATNQRVIGDDQSVVTWASAVPDDHVNEHVVDKTPSFTEKSGEGATIISGTTENAVRAQDDQSVVTWATFTTAGALQESYAVDRVPSVSNRPSSSISGNTTHALKSPDDQSVATWNTMTTAGARQESYAVDRVPSSSNNIQESVSGNTTNAIKFSDDQSVATWNTMTTAGARQESYAVDRVPSFSIRALSSVSGNTTNAIKDSADQSVATWNTVTTAGGVGGQAVDRVPSFTSAGATSIVTNETVQMGDNQSIRTWTTTNTMGGQMTGNMVDHVPSYVSGEAPQSSTISVPTTRAVQDERSVLTFTTNATAGERGIQEVVDRIPTYAGGAGRSVVSGMTSQAVRMSDDRSVLTFNTMTEACDLENIHEHQISDQSASSDLDRAVVDRLPSSAVGATSVVSGRTDYAVRASEDQSIATWNTMTTAGAGQYAVEENEGEIDDSVSSSSRPMAPGILRESRHNRPSALRENRGFRSPTTSSYAAPEVPLPPINAGESVSNAHILRAITDLRFHVDYRIGELRELNRRDSERGTTYCMFGSFFYCRVISTPSFLMLIHTPTVLLVVQQEQAKRTALEARLHSQLILQSESMVAMELKLLRLEAQVANRESQRQRRQPGVGGIPVTDRLPPIAATPSTPNRSDEEADSFEELDLTPRANRQGVGFHGGLSRGPIAVVTRSGASVASAVTATSFADGDFTRLHEDDARRSDGSEDGDVEDEMDDNNDGSASSTSAKTPAR